MLGHSALQALQDDKIVILSGGTGNPFVTTDTCAAIRAAELSAQALCILVGKQTNDTFGNSYKYIERYAEKAKLSPYSACLRVLSQTEKVLNLIMKGDKFHQEITRKLAA